jgi:hypothetical protein
MISRPVKSCLYAAAALTLIWALTYIIALQTELNALRSKEPLLSSIKDPADKPLLHSIGASITAPLLAKIAEGQADAAQKQRRPLLVPLTALEHASATTPEDAFLAEARLRAKTDPEAAMLWLQNQHSGAERLRGMLEVVALWATDDSESALLWLESNAQGLARLESLNTGVELWATSNPDAAAEWIEGMANDGSKMIAAKSLVTQWAETAPTDAAKWISGLPEGPIRTEATQALTKSWVQQDAQAASVWAFSEAEFNGNYDLLKETIREFTKQSPQDAEAFVRDMAEAKYAQLALSAHVIGRAQTDPIATAEWLSHLSADDPIYSPEYASDLMQVWTESDSIAASEWLSQQAPGEQRDAAVYGFSETIQAYEPAAAATWANTINDANNRVTRLTNCITTWARTKPHEALEWVKTAELEPAIRTHLANQIGAD